MNRFSLFLAILTPYILSLPYYSESPLDKSLVPNNADWMASLPDSISITTLAIPGTHDTCTFEFAGENELVNYIEEVFGRTQVWTLDDQLYAGIRYFDIRAGSDGKIYHSILQTTSTLTSVMESFSSFLKSHPGEGIIMRIQYNLSLFCLFGDCFEENIVAVLDKFKDQLLLTTTVPTVEQIRGKIFLIVEDMEYNGAFDWESGKITLQDDFRLVGDDDKEIEEKKMQVKEYMEKSRQDKNLFIINHCSASGIFALTTIKTIAKKVNQVPFTEENYGGIIPLDFPGEHLITHIININNRHKNIIDHDDDSEEEVHYFLK